MNIFEILRSFFTKMLQILLNKKEITNALSVYVKCSTGTTLSVELDPNWDIKNVKEIIAPQLGFSSADEVKIIFAGKELGDAITLNECDFGQKTILHAVKSRRIPIKCPDNPSLTEEEGESEEIYRPLSESLLEGETEIPAVTSDSEDTEHRKVLQKAQFFVYCSQCSKLCTGKLRVRCATCRGGAFTVHRDPECWDDVLKPHKVRGHCESQEIPCVASISEKDPPFAEFFFKCAEHPSQGEEDYSVALNLVKVNSMEVPCLACTETSSPILVFPCEAGHVTCLDCFRDFCQSRLSERQFISTENLGYTLSCPVGCTNSFIEETHHFRLLPKNLYDRYQRFATEEFVLQQGGVLCPQPGCGMGLLVEKDCRRVQCQSGCGYVFCRQCLQGYHLGECIPDSSAKMSENLQQFSVDPNRAADAKWDEASRTTIKISTKPCPKCRTATERDGGCMHMVCTRAGCGFEWCWVCQIAWSTECMGAHWFG
uniref:E3 ubiquitin-protein ligase parkin n=1 Tax=Phlebotomus papatasi TaxID=29031 RepID=A0A1B0GN34_PHLPP